jgi:penicillin-binding protein 2
VVVENGGHGGATAAPIARKLMDQYLLGTTGGSAGLKVSVPAEGTAAD